MSTESAYLGLVSKLFNDLVDIVPEYKQRDAEADAMLYESRIALEGASFATKILPALAKHLECSLETGSFKPCPGFARHKRRQTPKFLGALFKEIFDETGTLKRDASALAVGCIRQVCYFVYKLEMPYTDDLVAQCVENFERIDSELPQNVYGDPGSEQRRILAVGRCIITAIFGSFDPGCIFPQPGPGASASRTHKSHRYEPLVHFDMIHQVYPYYDYFYCGRGHLFDRLREYRSLPREKRGTSVLRCVPKDSRGPRLICMEPQEYMWLQQGLASAMRKHLESHWLTFGQVNFSDQSVNQKLALASSISGSYATLDMKDASDRISVNLVKSLFSGVPKLLRSLLALSTGNVQLPDGRCIESLKFAPMGSSLCFPVMSVVHFSLAVASLVVRYRTSYKALAKSVFIYGDDIIVPRHTAFDLFETFPKYGMLFNTSKSFYQGHFRESCGCDAFKGEDVTPQRLRKRFYDRPTADNLLSALEIEYHLRSRGFTRTSGEIRNMIQQAWLFRPMLWVHPNSGAVGFYTTDSDLVASQFTWHDTSYDHNLQCETIRVRTLVMRHDSSMIGCWERLARALLHTQQGDSSKLDGRFSRLKLAWRRLPTYQLC